MRQWIIPFVVMVLLLCGSTAFGDVNQFELETGSTVDTLMFPDAETTVEMTKDYSVKLMPFTEYVVTITTDQMIAAPVQFLDIPKQTLVSIEANAEWGIIYRLVGVHLKYLHSK